MSKTNNFSQFIMKQPLWKLGGTVVLLALAAYFFFGRSVTHRNGTTFAARRGPLQITVLEGGSVEALEAQEIRSQIKGYQGTKILSIVEEGYLVTEDDIKNGKLLVELDSSELKQRITTEEIQFQSTLATLIDAQQAYDIQTNQNYSDIKAAEQKARFARMDLAKHLGETNTQEIVGLLDLFEKAFTNNLDLADIESDAISSQAHLTENKLTASFPAGPGGRPAMPEDLARGSSSLGRRPSGDGQANAEAGSEPRTFARRPASAERGTPPGSETSDRAGMQGDAGGERRGGSQRPPRNDASQNETGTERAPTVRNRIAPGEAGPPGGMAPGRPALPPADFRNPGSGNVSSLALLANVAMPGTGAPSLTNVQSLMELSSLVRKDRATDARSLMAFTNAVTIDFSKYARAELLGDGSAKQQLRKLEDDFLIATQELSQAQIKLAGTERLYSSNFVTKTELDSDKLSVKRSEVKVAASQTALDLYNKYEFAKAAEEFVSKYDESLRSLERSRKEAISKLAQARARLKSAEGRFRIGTEQLQELYQQMSNCVIRAQRPGLVVYGRGDDRRFSGPEEQIREGATVRERQSIITIPDMTHMAVKLKIHESHIKKVKKGLKARIQVDAFPNEKLDGEVLKVGVLPDSQDRWMNPDMKVYVTSVAVEGMHEWLKPGMSAKVEILVQELPDVIYVPIQAIVPMKGKQYCFVANGGAPEERGVEVGEFNDEFIEIKRGLKEGEKVLLRAPEGVEKDTVGPEEGLEEESTGGGPAPSRSGLAAPPNNVGPPSGGAPPARTGPRPNRSQ